MVARVEDDLTDERVRLDQHGRPTVRGVLADALLSMVDRLGWRMATAVGVCGCVTLALGLTVLFHRFAFATQARLVPLMELTALSTFIISLPLLAVSFRLVAVLARTGQQLLIEVDRRVIAEQQLRRLATTDELTGLANRRHFVVRARELLAMAERYKQPVAMLALDIDRFKRINDRMGHASGDKALRRIAGIVTATLRATDVSARFGGDEFVVLMPQTDLAAASAAAERIRRAVVWDGQGFGLSVSVGVAAIRGGGLSLEDLMAQADQALYAAKNGGRNRVFQISDVSDMPEPYRGDIEMFEPGTRGSLAS